MSWMWCGSRKRKRQEVAADLGDCTICFERSSANCAALPCGHQCLCSDCAKSGLRDCPICRKRITKVVQIYAVAHRSELEDAKSQVLAETVARRRAEEAQKAADARRLQAEEASKAQEEAKRKAERERDSVSKLVLAESAATQKAKDAQRQADEKRVAAEEASKAKEELAVAETAARLKAEKEKQEAEKRRLEAEEAHKAQEEAKGRAEHELAKELAARQKAEDEKRRADEGRLAAEAAAKASQEAQRQAEELAEEAQVRAALLESAASHAAWTTAKKEYAEIVLEIDDD
mmetsp:Transcript_21008/g.40231  ORF Transcript_21008/g.40231 Transcript_21008/m.40231 type:complete len:290 (-) Transcript_21008:165-1034(-)